MHLSRGLSVCILEATFIGGFFVAGFQARLCPVEAAEGCDNGVPDTPLRDRRNLRWLLQDRDVPDDLVYDGVCFFRANKQNP